MTTSDPRPVHEPLDRQLARRVSADRLVEEMRGVFGRETILELLDSSYDELAVTATMPDFLPLLAERFARQRLHALARVEERSADRRPVALFLCTHNAGRSQMALGFFAAHAGEAAVGWSGGSRPGGEVNPVAVQAMAERGVDIATEYPKPWTDEVVRAADVVVTMGCGDACPVFPGTTYRDWEVADPDGRDLAEVRAIRDDVERRVLELLEELGLPVDHHRTATPPPAPTTQEPAR